MLRSVVANEEKSDYKKIWDKAHVEKVIASFKENLPEYLEGLYTEDEEELEGLAQLGKVKKKEPTLLQKRKTIKEYLDLGRQEYWEKEQLRYHTLFNASAMEEYLEMDARTFKTKVRSGCPVIHYSVQSRSEKMQEWQERFAAAAPQDVLDTIANILDLAADYVKRHPESKYAKFNKLSQFQELYDEWTENKDYTLPSVIGAGIKSTIAYYMYPAHFARCVKRTLYGFYFLTGQSDFGLPSRNSEFIMIDDLKKWKGARGSEINFTMEQNYWYPYDLFMYYSKFLYDELKAFCDKYGVDLEYKYRYVDLYTFLDMVCSYHEDEIQTMMGGDQE